MDVSVFFCCLMIGGLSAAGTGFACDRKWFLAIVMLIWTIAFAVFVASLVDYEIKKETDR